MDIMNKAIFNIANYMNSKADLEVIASCYEEGMSIEEMQIKFGISKRKINRCLNKLASTMPFTFLTADSARDLKLGTH